MFHTVKHMYIQYFKLVVIFVLLVSVVGMITDYCHWRSVLQLKHESVSSVQMRPWQRSTVTWSTA